MKYIIKILGKEYKNKLFRMLLLLAQEIGRIAGETFTTTISYDLWQEQADGWSKLKPKLGKQHSFSVQFSCSKNTHTHSASLTHPYSLTHF